MWSSTRLYLWTSFICNLCKLYHKFLSDTVLYVFADDTNLFLSDEDISNLYKTMNQELKQVNLWLTANKVSLEFNKTHFMILKSKKKRNWLMVKN